MEGEKEDCPLLLKKNNVDEEKDVVNVTEHSKKRDFTGNLALSILACVLGSSFQFGYNTGVVNSPAEVIKSFYTETYTNRTGNSMSSNTLTVLWAITVSIFAVGGMIGGFSAGYWANRFGRRGALLRNNALAVIGAVVLFSSKYAKSYEMLIGGRFIIGINAGINTGIAPLYLSEIAPLSLRGFCGTLNQLAICSGVMISQILGLSYVLGTDDLWQFAIGFSVIPVIFQLCTLSCCPESPRYLYLTKDEVDDAEIALQWLRKSINVSDEINEMASEKLAQSKSKKFSFGDLLKSPSLKAPLIISLVMQLSNQFSGINAVVYYSTTIFKSAGLNNSQAQVATVSTGAVNVCMTFVSALIMDRAGRRSLHLIGLGGMFVGSLILALGLIFQVLLLWLVLLLDCLILTLQLLLLLFLLLSYFHNCYHGYHSCHFITRFS